jgi:anti-sigma regulatory factor (Ser/Thr protein kinase)
LFLESCAIPETTRFELRTILYEVVHNIRSYAGLTPRDQISVHATVGRDRITIEVSDPGSPFDPTQVQVASTFIDIAQNRRKRGLGLPMLKRMTDTMLYSRSTDGRNVLTIEKTWETADEHAC